MEVITSRGKQITAKNPQMIAIYRFVGRLIYIKASSTQHAADLVDKVKKMGGTVRIGRGWIECDIIRDHDEVKLGSLVLDISKLSDSDIAEQLCEFFRTFLTASGYECEVVDL